MIEKIKDVLYDVSDIFLSLLIISLIFFVVSWKISDSLSFDVAVPEKNTSPTAPTDTAKIPSENIASSSDVPSPKPILPDNVQDPSAKPEAPSVNTPTSEPPSTHSAEKTIEIKSGSSGFAIAKQLTDAGLVPSTDVFIKRVEALKLGSKLRSGTFTLSTSMTIDEIIYKISGK